MFLGGKKKKERERESKNHMGHTCTNGHREGGRGVGVGGWEMDKDLRRLECVKGITALLVMGSTHFVVFAWCIS